MSTNRLSPALRPLLLADAATCTAMGAVLALASGPLGRATALPPDLLFHAGLLLFPIAAFMAAVASRRAIHLGAARLIVLGNLGWVAGSLLLAGWVSPNALGTAFLLAQAMVVAALAWLEQAALRQSVRAAPGKSPARRTPPRPLRATVEADRP